MATWSAAHPLAQSQRASTSKKNKSLLSHIVPNLRTHHRRETSTTRTWAAATQPSNCTTRPQHQSPSSSRNSHMDNRPNIETTSVRGSRSMANTQAGRRTTPHGQPRARGTLTTFRKKWHKQSKTSQANWQTQKPSANNRSSRYS